ncbi:hypothetical protein DRQ25_11085 [Candidatus Fermentibacteria bacterium]|nr:MAG: hypothetical protein DRQ25_11085 [Candidatus Fermentibacteria bacterium]
MSISNRLVFDPTDANSIAASSTIGAHLMSSDSTLLTHVTNGAREELDVNDKVAGDLLATIDADTSAMATDLAAIEVLLTSIDSDTGDILADTNAMVTDLAAIEVLLTSIDSDTDAIKTSVELIDDLVLYEDAVHGSGDPGTMSLAVRNDTLATLVSADGDYAPLQVNADGALYVDIGNALNIDVNDVCNVAIENTATAVSVSAVAIVSSALANRSKVFVANEGNKSLYTGKAGVTTSNGFPLHPGMQHEYNLGPTPIMQVIGGTGASSEDLRVMEMS